MYALKGLEGCSGTVCKHGGGSLLPAAEASGCACVAIGSFVELFIFQPAGARQPECRQAVCMRRAQAAEMNGTSSGKQRL